MEQGIHGEEGIIFVRANKKKNKDKKIERVELQFQSSIVTVISAVRHFVTVTVSTEAGSVYGQWRAQPSVLISLGPAALSADLSLHLHFCNKQH